MTPPSLRLVASRTWEVHRIEEQVEEPRHSQEETHSAGNSSGSSKPGAGDSTDTGCEVHRGSPVLPSLRPLPDPDGVVTWLWGCVYFAEVIAVTT